MYVHVYIYILQLLIRQNIAIFNNAVQISIQYIDIMNLGKNDIFKSLLLPQLVNEFFIYLLAMVLSKKTKKIISKISYKSNISRLLKFRVN